MEGSLFSAFVRAALRGSAVPVIEYRDYNIADSRPNLPPEVVLDKREIFRRYARHDHVVSMQDPYDAWLRSSRPRWPAGSGWARA